ncbi:MAG: uroporphyrinogen decarboxylase family protein, partial [Thermodesulfobacteriota bacterium]
VNCFWPETIIEWVKQGAPVLFADALRDFFSSRVDEYFGFEPFHILGEIDSGLRHGIEFKKYGETAFLDNTFLVSPKLESRVIEEDDRTLTFTNSCGQTVKIFKDKPTNMPMFMDWPVKDRTSWREFKKRLDPSSPARYPDDWDGYVQRINSLTEPVALEVGGFFGYMREWVGSERVLYLFYDDPALVEDMMDTILHLEMEIIKKVSKDIRFEIATYWEDMAFNAGPLISPTMVRKFMMPRYKKLNELLHSMGVDVIFVDCDGNLDLLIPLWLECGINFVWPMEVAAGNDAVAARKKYGTDLIFGGAIDKRALIKGKEAIKEEVMSKAPFLLEKGGYFPSVDHMVPPDVTFENFCYFVNLLREIAGVDKLQF